jgi:tetratricopeptide (TPR) repeat protein
MWFSGFNQIYYNKIDIGLYCLELGLLTLGIIIILKFETLKIFNNFQNGLEYYNSIVERSPNNTIFLNNKGVQLTVKRKYGKAISYFDKVLEIDYNNNVALKNKKALIKKMEHNTLSDYLEDYPKLEVIEKKGILFLEIKSK